MQPAIRIRRADHQRQIRVINAATETLMFSFFPFGKSYRGSFRLQTTDVDGDGVPEIIARTGIGHDRFVTRVFSGLNGSRLPDRMGAKVRPEPSSTSHSA
jgi:hypothetical protein